MRTTTLKTTSVLIFALACGAAAESGYPRPLSFRSISPAAVADGHFDHIEMAISDLHTYARKDAAQTFKEKFPDRLALIQINMERTGLWGSWQTLPPQRLADLGWLDPAAIAGNPQLEILGDGRYPMPDFAGFWTYDAGDNILNTIPAGAETVTVKVGLPERFKPSTHVVTVRTLKEITGQDFVHRDVVIRPRGKDGEPDWLNAEMGTITALDEAAGTVTIRRWKTANPWKAHPAGTYIAANSVLLYIRNEFEKTGSDPARRILQPWLPNLTEFAPRDPRTGLNAREWLARWYAGFWKKHGASLDGMVFDVSVGTFYPSTRVSSQADCNNDGRPDAFFFDNINYWPLGIHDFFHTLRHGLPKVFEGVGDGCLLASDSNHNEDQRFFHLLNGGEYEYSMNPVWHMPYTLSGMIDRLLLWGERGRKPDVTFVSSKVPDEAYHGGDRSRLKGVMTLSHWRMDMAAACMTSGYLGKDISRTIGQGPEAQELLNYPGSASLRRKYRFPPPPVYDEFHGGTGTNFNWLGRPSGPPQRADAHLGPLLYRYDAAAAGPAMQAQGEWKAGAVSRTGRAFTLRAEKVGPWLEEHDSWNCYGTLPLGNTAFEKDAEYTVRFTVQGSNPWKGLSPRYSSIPKNLRVRFNVDGVQQIQLLPSFKGSYFQEVLVFEAPRECVLTLKAPASGTGAIEFDLSENAGEVTIGNLEIRKGCGDVLYRKFEQGLVVFNGSYSEPVAVDFARLCPGESYARIKGAQDPVHNNGERVEGSLSIPPHDGYFLRRQPKP